MKNLSILFLFFLVYSTTYYAQSANDVKRNQNWLLGNNSGIPVYMNFNTYPLTMKYNANEPLTFSAPYAYGLMSDTLGQYLFYTSGYYVFDRTLQPLINGDTLIPPSVGTGAWAGNQATIILPYPNHQNQYYIPNIMFSNRLDLEAPDRIVSAVADFNRPDGRGQLINRGVVVHDSSTFNAGLGACRHGNGRDWWMLNNCFQYSNRYNRYLLNPTGMRYLGTQVIGQTDDGAGQIHASFSPNGTKYALMDAHFTVDSQYVTLKHLKVFDFDRCTGRLSNPQELVLPLERSWTVGIAFSPNSRFIYISLKFNWQMQFWQTVTV
jgi:hypothetical protein